VIVFGFCTGFFFFLGIEPFFFFIFWAKTNLPQTYVVVCHLRIFYFIVCNRFAVFLVLGSLRSECRWLFWLISFRNLYEPFCLGTNWSTRHWLIFP
jgi:hypothetical protein